MTPKLDKLEIEYNRLEANYQRKLVTNADFDASISLLRALMKERAAMQAASLPPKEFTDEQGRLWKLSDYGYTTASDIRLHLRRSIMFGSQEMQAAALPASQPVDAAYGYASRLFKHLAPQCEPLSTTLGVLTQLDNFIAGLLQPQPVDAGLVEKLEARIEQNHRMNAANPLHAGGMFENNGLRYAIALIRQKAITRPQLESGVLKDLQMWLQIIADESTDESSRINAAEALARIEALVEEVKV